MEHVTTVFIADSAEDFCTALSAALQRADGFQVVGTANDGELAIRMIEERKPDLLVLDLMLAKKDGISVLKAIANLERRPMTLATSVLPTRAAPSMSRGRPTCTETYSTVASVSS